VVNLRAVLAVPQGQMVRPVGLKSRWVRGLVQGRHPIWSVGVGGLFALSFDTLTQAALFAVAGSSYSAAHAALLALMFLAGMLVTDGLNGWWISRLLARADARAARASRVMSAGVAGVSLGVAALGVARWLSPLLDDWADARGALFSAVVVAVVLASYLAARVLARRPQSAWA
jgi:high-affinity nickel-transport protein